MKAATTAATATASRLRWPTLTLAASTLLYSTCAFVATSSSRSILLHFSDAHINDSKRRQIQDRSLSIEAVSENHDFESLRVPELKEMLRARGLKVGGRKAELIDRLRGNPPADVPSSKEAASTMEDISPTQFDGAIPLDGIVIEAGKS